MRKSRKRGTLIGLAAASIVALSATPAFAIASVGASGNCGYNQVCTGYAQSVIGVGTGTDVVVSCSAETPYTVQATIVQCYIVGNTGDIHWTTAQLFNGQASTLTHTFDAWQLRSNAYQICVGAGLFDGTYHAPTNFSCGATI